MEIAASSTDGIKQLLLIDLTFLLILTSDLYWKMYSAPEHTSLFGALDIDASHSSHTIY